MSDHLMRPPSSAASRPASSLSRPASSLSRPSSSASHRTVSRLSNRPTSRHSIKTPTRQSTRLAPPIQLLVSLVTGLKEDADGEAYADALDVVARKLDSVTKQGMGTDLQELDARMKGLSLKYRIQSRDILAEALDISWANLQVEALGESDIDSEISISRLPDHVQFLLALSAPPSTENLRQAEAFVEKTKNPPKPDPGLTWKDILTEEPFEGQHWEGAYGLPPGSVKSRENLTDSDAESPYLSPVSDVEELELSDPYEDSEVSFQLQTPPPPHQHRDSSNHISRESLSQSLSLRQELELLQGRQYWRDDWRIKANISRPFEITDSTTFGPATQSILNSVDGVIFTNTSDEKYINDHDAVREVLLCLQGRSNLLLMKHFDDTGSFNEVKVCENLPLLLRLSRMSEVSLLSAFGCHATALEHLRIFASTVISSVTQVSKENRHWHSTRTVEALAEAIDIQVQKVSSWSAKREEEILRAVSNVSPTIVSLMDTEKAFRDEFSDIFSSLVDILRSCFQKLALPFDDFSLLHNHAAPSIQSSTLLDCLFNKVQNAQAFGDMRTFRALMDVFIASAEPVWRMTSRWLSVGLFGTGPSGQTDLEAEFFIEGNDLPLSDRDFWSEGYVLRTSTLLQDGGLETSLDVPVFLKPTSESILSAGRSIGLLRILDDNGDMSSDVLKNLVPTELPCFSDFLQDASKALSTGHMTGTHSPLDASRSGVSLTIDDFALILRERLLPRCQVVEKALLGEIYSNCGFYDHLSSIEGLYLMRKGDGMADFCDLVFSQMDARKPWTDFHFLNNAFRDTVDFQRIKWINSSLVRLSHRSSPPDSGSAAIRHSVRQISGLYVAYAAPFPLYYIFDQECVEMYNEIFVFLMQLRRTKTVLDGILIRKGNNVNLLASDLKALYATRGRLSWFVNTMCNFIGSHVLQTAVSRLRGQLVQAASLDEAILLHRAHLARMTTGCFLDAKTANIRKALLSILDLSMVFGRNFVSLSGNPSSSFDVSNLSISISRHKSKRQRRLNRDFISFHDAKLPVLADDASDDSESDTDDFLTEGEPEDVDVSLQEGDMTDPFSQNEKISSDLNNFVRFIRHNVETLALSKQTEKDAPFDVLSFALQDWDL